MVAVTFEKNISSFQSERDVKVDTPLNWAYSYDQLKNRYQDHDYIGAVLADLHRQVQQWAGVHEFCRGYQPLLVDSNLPANQDWSEFPAELVPDLQQLVLDHPELLITLADEIKKTTHSTREQINETRGSLYDEDRKPRQKMWKLLDELEELESLLRGEVVHRLWLHALVQAKKITAKEADAKVAELSAALELMGEAVKEKVYLAHCLEQAQQVLSYFAPSLAPLIKEVSSDVIFVREYRPMKKLLPQLSLDKKLSNQIRHSPNQLELQSSQNKMAAKPEDELEVAMDKLDSITRYGDGWMANMVEGQPILFKPKRIDAENKSHYVFHIMVAAHELLHLVMAKQFGFDQQPIQKSENSPTLNLEQQQEPKKYGFSRVLLEGISMGLEHLVLSNMEINDGQDPELIAGAVAFGEYRVLSNRFANRFWSMQKRLAYGDPDSGYVPATEELSRMTYSEGARLALALHRRGWTLDDIPDLVKQVTETVIAKTGITDVDEWEKQILLKRAGADKQKSPYEQVIEAIRQLKPSRLQ